MYGIDIAGESSIYVLHDEIMHASMDSYIAVVNKSCRSEKIYLRITWHILGYLVLLSFHDKSQRDIILVVMEAISRLNLAFMNPFRKGIEKKLTG